MILNDYWIIVERSSDASVGIEHNSELSSHGLWWKVSCELCSYGSIVSMCLSDSAPDNSESGVSACVLGFEDVSNSLSLVESSILLITNTLDFQKSELFWLGALSSLEASENSLGVESIAQSFYHNKSELT